MTRQTVSLVITLIVGLSPMLMMFEAILRGKTFWAVGYACVMACVLVIMWHAKKRTEGL